MVLGVIATVALFLLSKLVASKATPPTKKDVLPDVERDVEITYQKLEADRRTEEVREKDLEEARAEYAKKMRELDKLATRDRASSTEERSKEMPDLSDPEKVNSYLDELEKKIRERRQ